MRKSRQLPDGVSKSGKIGSCDNANSAYHVVAIGFYLKSTYSDLNEFRFSDVFDLVDRGIQPPKVLKKNTSPNAIGYSSMILYIFCFICPCSIKTLNYFFFLNCCMLSISFHKSRSSESLTWPINRNLIGQVLFYSNQKSYLHFMLRCVLCCHAWQMVSKFKYAQYIWPFERDGSSFCPSWFNTGPGL